MSQRSSLREKKLSQRATDAQEAGETVPGIGSPGRAILRSSSVDSQATTLPSILTGMRGSTISQPGTSEDYLSCDKFDVSVERRAHDVDVGQDDWNDFENFLDNRGIAGAFMHRAKRAFWAGKAWKEFEREERSIVPVTLNWKGEQIDDPYVLDNGRRMEIFEAIKVRLCEETWDEDYPDPSIQAASSMTGLRHDTPGPVAEEREPTKDQRAEGIIMYTKNSEGSWEPWYDHEAVINPSGIMHGIRASRKDAASPKPDLVREMEDSD